MSTQNIQEDITITVVPVVNANYSPTSNPPVKPQSTEKSERSAGVSRIQSPKQLKRSQLRLNNISYSTSKIPHFSSKIQMPNKNAFFPTTEIRVCTQQERLQHIKSECEKLRSRMTKAVLRPASRTLADEIHHLLYCYMSKVGCTAFKMLLAKANMHAMGQNTAYSKPWKVHKTKRLARIYNLPKLFYFSNEEITRRLTDYFKFMIMRHPFERLISAWRDKVVNIKQSEYKDWPARIFKHTRPFLFGKSSVAHSTVITDKDMETASKHSPPRFDEFVTWIADNKIQNEHWLSAIESCHVCANDWDAIFRIETMVTDKRILLDRLKDDIDPREDITVVHSMQSNITFFFPVKELDLWKNISRPVVNYFLEKYQDDMQLFGYQWDERQSRTVCSINTPSGPCC